MYPALIQPAWIRPGSVASPTVTATILVTRLTQLGKVTVMLEEQETGSNQSKLHGQTGQPIGIYRWGLLTSPDLGY